jgi:hypothetical protein
VANALKRPFGCFGRIDYPLTDHAERVALLEYHPSDAPLVWSLLGETLRELNEQSAMVESVAARRVSTLNPF